MAEAIRGPRAIVGIRRRLVEAAVPSTERDVQRYFRGMARRVQFTKAAKAGPLIDHARERSLLKETLDQTYARMTETVWTDVVNTQIGSTLDFDLNARGVREVLDKVATRVSMIDASSQRMIADTVARGIERDGNTDRVERDVRDLLRSWGEDGGRAHIIALTETANAYNQSAVAGYRESGLVEMVEVYDGPDCGWTEHDDPDLADGSTRTLDEAEEYPEAHPHCQRAFGPVVLTEEEPVGSQPDEEGSLLEVPGETPGIPEEVSRHIDDLAERYWQGQTGADRVMTPWGAYAEDALMIQRNVDVWTDAAARAGQTLEAFREAARVAMQNALDAMRLSIRVDVEVVEKIVKDGRLKSQFETGTSGGAMNNSYRGAAERYMFGTPEASAAAERPIYGYMRPATAAGHDSAAQYGDVILEFGPGTRGRATVTFGDSLGNTRITPSPLNAVRPSSADVMFDGIPRAGSVHGSPYIEAQVHGGVKWEEVSRAVVTRAPAEPELQQALRDGGMTLGTPWNGIEEVWIRP